MREERLWVIVVHHESKGRGWKGIGFTYLWTLLQWFEQTLLSKDFIHGVRIVFEKVGTFSAQNLKLLGLEIGKCT
jgi:hypothetical protein